ncbi:MAG TPA: peptidylprolyl isomerase [Ktedonobacteraceae bacterium]|nr:peptidylprolyl isomerase [Ktedonobacteraceae bacterium]
MASQTEQPVKRPAKQKTTRSTKSKRYYKQTAHVEARRDGKPLIFGWGKHLSHAEKVKLQRRATWTMAGIFGLLIVGTILAFWININIITPGKPITSVNGHDIPQSQYRKMVAVKTQLAYNNIYGKGGLEAQASDLTKQDAAQLKKINDLTKQVDTLNKEIKALPAGPSQQRTNLENQLTSANKQLSDAQTTHQNLSGQINNLNQNTIPLVKQSFTQSQVGNDSVTWLQDDELVREWLATQSPAIQNKVNPTDAQVNKALNDLKATLPTTTSYSSFLSQMGISNDDVISMLTIKVRRDNMQNYLASQIVSPTYQVLSRTITVDTEAAANKILQELKNGGDFGKIASKESKDTSTASSGGSQGWLARGQYALNQNAAVVENWLFDPSRYIFEISPVLKENGSYHIAQIMGIDPSRAVDKSTLQTLQYNALSNWLLEQQALPTTRIASVDQNMLLDPMNLPPTSILPSGAPSTAVPGSGVPSGP